MLCREHPKCKRRFLNTKIYEKFPPKSQPLLLRGGGILNNSNLWENLQQTHPSGCFWGAGGFLKIDIGKSARSQSQLFGVLRVFNVNVLVLVLFTQTPNFSRVWWKHAWDSLEHFNNWSKVFHGQSTTQGDITFCGFLYYFLENSFHHWVMMWNLSGFFVVEAQIKPFHSKHAKLLGLQDWKGHFVLDTGNKQPGWVWNRNHTSEAAFLRASEKENCSPPWEICAHSFLLLQPEFIPLKHSTCALHLGLFALAFIRSLSQFIHVRTKHWKNIHFHWCEILFNEALSWPPQSK